MPNTQRSLALFTWHRHYFERFAHVTELLLLYMIVLPYVPDSCMHHHCHWKAQRLACNHGNTAHVGLRMRTGCQHDAELARSRSTKLQKKERCYRMLSVGVESVLVYNPASPYYPTSSYNGGSQSDNSDEEGDLQKLSIKLRHLYTQ